VKTYRFNLQKAVNTPVNSISTHSVQHLKDKVERLCQLLDGQRVEVVGVSVSIKTHPLAGEFCLNLLAKKFVVCESPCFITGCVITDPSPAPPTAPPPPRIKERNKYHRILRQLFPLQL
jgi:hypothetical protein